MKQRAHQLKGRKLYDGRRPKQGSEKGTTKRKETVYTRKNVKKVAEKATGTAYSATYMVKKVTDMAKKATDVVCTSLNMSYNAIEPAVNKQKYAIEPSRRIGAGC